MITKDNAGDFQTFSRSDVISMVDFYFASRIRGDEKWRDVLPPEEEWSSKMKRSVESHDKWEFLEYKNNGLKNDNERYVTVYFKISFNGKTDDGTDEVEVKKLGNEWMIKKVPS
ncbi:MAG: hypothetical protein HUJ25_04095 [Crocinitomicaceae bacterium]|nr:hypothetical protein [Crocinitomicaceae bacterium]